jgi:O-acetyl-ADP-ribose deacetylase (regulator of RNase III)
MPIKFVSYSQDFVDIMNNLGFESFNMNIEEYQLDSKVKHTYYVSAGNSLGYMDGEIDLSLSRIVFPGVDKHVNKTIKKYGKENLVGIKYLPIGSSIIIKYNETKSLIVAPVPQDVSTTDNTYYATMAALYHLVNNLEQKLTEVDVIFTSICCGYGKMTPEESSKQIIQGIVNYPTYVPNKHIINLQDYITTIIINEPNLKEQLGYLEDYLEVSNVIKK